MRSNSPFSSHQRPTRCKHFQSTIVVDDFAGTLEAAVVGSLVNIGAPPARVIESAPSPPLRQESTLLADSERARRLIIRFDRNIINVR